MNKRKLGVAVSAMILAVYLGNPVTAEPSLEQLDAIATILTDNDVAALCDYLELNPELLEGDTQLAVLLREFRRESRDLTSCLGIEPNLRDALLRDEMLPSVPGEGSDSGEDEDPDEGTGSNNGSDPDDGRGPDDPDDRPGSDNDPDGNGVY